METQSGSEKQGKSEVEQGSEGLKGDQYKIQMQHGTTPIGWSFCHKVKEFLCPLSPATHLFFFTQILQEAISGRRCHGLWRKDRFFKNQYFDRNHVWMYGEWEHHFKRLRIKETLLLSWGACRKQWLGQPQDDLSTSVVPVLGCHISCQIRTRRICYGLSSMCLGSRLSEPQK